MILLTCILLAAGGAERLWARVHNLSGEERSWSDEMLHARFCFIS